MMKLHYLLPVLLLLGACAIGPKYDTSAIDPELTPQRAVAEAVQNKPVVWGGVIINAENLKQATQFEILAYPLNSNQKPDVGKPPLGRFLAQKAGYLETADYAQGRLLTVNAIVQDSRVGRIGESDYTYPLVNIRQQYLWPQRSEPSDTRFHFSIGVMFRN